MATTALENAKEQTNHAINFFVIHFEQPQWLTTLHSPDLALKSKDPSSLSLESLRRKEQLRLQQGRGNIGIGTNQGSVSGYQKQFDISYKRGSLSLNSPDITNLPKLKQSVPSLPGADQVNKALDFLEPPSEPGIESYKMAGQSTLRQLESKYGAKPGKSGTSMYVLKENWQALTDDFRALQAEVSSFAKENKKLAAENKRLEKELKDSTVSASDSNARANEYKLKYEKLSSKKRGKGKSAQVNRKDEQKDDVNAAISSYVKDVLFRTHKFALPGEALVQTTKLVWTGIKDNLKLDQGSYPLTEDDFVEIYESTVLSELSGRRQYCQSRCKLAADEWLKTHAELPTVEEIEKVWDITPPVEVPDSDDETEDARKQRENSAQQKKHERSLEVLTWWLDSFMPHAVGLDFWGPDIRCFYFMTDLTLIPGDPSGKQKVYVTVTSEAFAHLLFANCRDKWQATHEYVKAHQKGSKKVRVPAYDKDDATTHVYQNKWSNSRTGQVVGGGWSEEALGYFNKKKQDVLAFRKDQAEKKDFSAYKLAKQLICTANDVKLEGKQGPVNSKKRKAAQNAEQPAGKKIEIVYIDE